MKMKIQVTIISVVVLVVVCFALVDRTYAGLTRAQMEGLAKGFRSRCVRKVHADMALVAGLRDGQFVEGNYPLKCYTKCIMLLMKTLKNNKADVSAMSKQIKAMASDDIADRLVDAAQKCYTEINEEDLCEYTWKYTICTYKADPDAFFFP